MGWDDNRGVSEVLGAMLLFGIIIVALGGYQTFVVPQQNAEIEINHQTQVEDEFAEIQASISNAAATGTSRTTSMTLGTQYPARAAGLNPPTVSGQLSTRHAGEISADVFNGTSTCGLPPETKAITYRANYNELDDTGTLVYENGVTYQDVNEQVLVRNDQELVDGSTIRLYPLIGGDFSTGSSSSKQLQFVPGETGTRTITTSGTWNLTYPSRARNLSWQDKFLDGSDKVYEVTDSGGEVTITFKQGTYTIHCTPVGIGSKPNQKPVPSEKVDPKEEADKINPVSNGKVVLNETSNVGSNGNATVTLKFKNKTGFDSKISIVGARLNYYLPIAQGNSPGIEPDTVEIGNTNLSVGGKFESLSSEIRLNPDETGVILEFDAEVGIDHFYVLTLEFSHGDVSTYFVSHQK